MLSTNVSLMLSSDVEAHVGAHEQLQPHSLCSSFDTNTCAHI